MAQGNRWWVARMAVAVSLVCTAAAAAQRPLPARTGLCGASAGTAPSAFPARGLCAAGNSAPIDTLGLDGRYDWTCSAGSVASCSAAATAPATAPFTAFESAHVRPLALSADGARLYAVNTPDNRLTIYDVTDTALRLAGEVPVGLEPVSVALRTDAAGGTEAWVVNHLSDSISIVGIDPANPAASQVERTLLVGDEPRDIVFAGAQRNRAFVTAAHRGQNRPGDAQLRTEGVGRADVWVFDADAPGAALGGTPLTVLELFGDTPRALAVSADGASVYAAVFASGNRTTTIPQPVVARHGGLPPPPAGSTPDAPEVGLIVRQAIGGWLDEIGRDWSAQVPFSLPDKDVFRIDANASPPREIESIRGVGTVIFNLAVRPGSGKLYAANTEALNEQRFEPMLSGRFLRNRISVIDGTQVLPVHLNPHIDYRVGQGPAQEIGQSLSSPAEMVFSADGARVYVAAFGSAKVGVFDADVLEAGAISGQRIAVGQGPSGLALDAARDRLYVMNRIDHSLSIVSGLSTAPSVATLALPFDPEPASLHAGRRFLYDARITSGHGDVSCHSCHLFGDMDHLAWDLGNPFGRVTPNPHPAAPVGGRPPSSQPSEDFHPMKGPMTTQSLRGLADAGPMHWRGDRTGGLTPEGEIDPEGDTLDENAAFLRFNAAFVGLQGRASELEAADMQAFADFALQLRYPPNPMRRLDNIETLRERQGRETFTDNELIPLIQDEQACIACHTLPLTTSAFMAKNAFQTPSTAQDEFKVPHLRNLYQKIGMFGAAQGAITGQPQYLVGDQVRGFGFLHDGSLSTIDVLLHHPSNLLLPIPGPGGLTVARKREYLETFLLSLDTGLRPVVGQQLSLRADTRDDEQLAARLDLLLAQADAGAAEVIVKGVHGGMQRGALYVGAGSFMTDRAADGTLSRSQLLALLDSGTVLTFTAVPPGNGLRLGIDRDLDGQRDSE